jgi:hypothetical protein
VTFAASNAPFPVPESYMISWSKELKRRQRIKLRNQNLCDTINCFALVFGYVRHIIPSRIIWAPLMREHSLYGYGNNNHNSLSELV